MGFIVGREDCIHFWFDNCVGVGPLFVCFPRLFRAVSNKKSSTKDCYVNEVNNVMGSEFRRAQNQSESVEYKSMLCLFPNIFICRNNDDSHIWTQIHLGSSPLKSFCSTSEISWEGTTLCTSLVGFDSLELKHFPDWWWQVEFLRWIISGVVVGIQF